MSSVTATIDTVLAAESLSVFLQPIYLLEPVRRVWALEALVRGPSGTPYENAAVLFDYLRFKHEEARGDRSCIARVLEVIPALPGDAKLSINVHASTLERDSGFAEFLESSARRNGFRVDQLIIEVVEQSPYWNRERLLGGIGALRELGATIAVDDVGAGFCNLAMIVDLRPSILKLDGQFTRGCTSDRYCRAVARAVLQLAHDIGASAIAECVETEADVCAVEQLGFELAQGYALGRPALVIA